MGWYRKAFRLGPLRLNLSKRGVGASVGVKGARLGVDASGKPYVAGGRGGLYFRQRLGGEGRTQQQGQHVQPMAPVPPSDSLPTWKTRPVMILLVLAVVVGFVLALVWMARGAERVVSPGAQLEELGEGDDAP